MSANSLATPDKRSSAMTSTTAKSLVTSTTNKKKLGMQINQAKAGSRAAGNAGDLSGISPIKYPASRRRVDFNKGPASLSKKKRELTKKDAGSKNRKSVQKGCQTKCTNETSRQSDLKNRSCQDLHGAGTQQRKKFAQMESKIRRHELESKSHKSRIQAMNLQIQEKDRIIRNLESKLPKVLADVSRGLQTRENSKKPWREARNNQGLVGQQLTAKSEECDQLRKQNSRLREDAKLLNNIIRSNQAELDAERTRVARLEEELISLHQKMSSHIQESNSRMEYLQDENEYLYSEIRYQYDALLETEEDIKKIEQFLSNLISNFPSFQEVKREDLSTKAKDLLKEEEKSEFFNISRDGIVSGNITWPARSRRKWKLPKVTALAELFHPKEEEGDKSVDESLQNTTDNQDNIVEDDQTKNKDDNGVDDNSKDQDDVQDLLDQVGDTKAIPKAKQKNENDYSKCLIDFSICSVNENLLFQSRVEAGLIGQSQAEHGLIDQSQVEHGLIDHSQIEHGLIDQSHAEGGLIDQSHAEGGFIDQSEEGWLDNCDEGDELEVGELSEEWNSSDEFENSEDKSQFCNRLENLDFQLEVLLNKLNNTANKSTLN